MYSRSELEFKLKVRDARVSLRLAVFSIAIIVPVWMGAFVAQRLGFARQIDFASKPIGIALLVTYFAGVMRIWTRAGREAEVTCPKCGASLGLSLKKVLKARACPKCGEKLLK